jgi:hypothetical protein
LWCQRFLVALQHHHISICTMYFFCSKGLHVLQECCTLSGHCVGQWFVANNIARLLIMHSMNCLNPSVLCVVLRTQDDCWPEAKMGA